MSLKLMLMIFLEKQNSTKYIDKWELKAPIFTFP
jgi:hypothetical protein